MAGVPGVAVTAIVAGAALTWSGITGRPVVDIVRGVLSGAGPGTVPKAAVPAGAPAESLDSSTSIGPKIAAIALAHLGVPYVWGGETPSGWDCSGYTTWVLGQAGVTGLPSAVHTTAGQFLVWRGATTVPKAQRAPGDLVCYGGHVGIYVGDGKMANAPGRGVRTQVQRVWGSPAYRRVNLG